MGVSIGPSGKRSASRGKREVGSGWSGETGDDAIYIYAQSVSTKIEAGSRLAAQQAPNKYGRGAYSVGSLRGITMWWVLRKEILIEPMKNENRRK